MKPIIFYTALFLIWIVVLTGVWISMQMHGIISLILFFATPAAAIVMIHKLYKNK